MKGHPVVHKSHISHWRIPTWGPSAHPMGVTCHGGSLCDKEGEG